ncbi:MAG: 3-oxoacyl-[acyl-carrier-protein] reductase [Candidatus Amoebophilus sp. 36-38]|nr:MAG: 3-oxoacyl-[acyl-carrier-protein] reductase [Candidatus Amoebophilus sp. 36-38]
MKQLTGKTAFITGASRGIGKAIAHSFAEQGANIVFTHLSSVEQGQVTADELKVHGVEVHAYRSDASNFSAVNDLIQKIVQDFGRLDILVNNAGITRDNLLLRMSEQDWDEVMQVNLKSVFNTIKAVTKPMISQRYGSIINISSVVGIKGNAGQVNYAASKAGIIGLTKSVALELGSRNIRCNAIAPGFIQTAMTEELSQAATEEWVKYIPLKRVGMPEDVANCALFLASDTSSYITGQVIQVDGGMLT